MWVRHCGDGETNGMCILILPVGAGLCDSFAYQLSIRSIPKARQTPHMQSLLSLASLKSKQANKAAILNIYALRLSGALPKYNGLEGWGWVEGYLQCGSTYVLCIQVHRAEEVPSSTQLHPLHLLT